VVDDHQAVRLGLPKVAMLLAVKTAHTAVWLTVEVAFGVVLYDGVTRRRGRRTALAAAVVGGESLIYLANGARCPMTSLAESLGADKGSVTDIFLPRWIARNLPILHLPLVVAALWLHGRRRWTTRGQALSQTQHRPTTAPAGIGNGDPIRGSGPTPT